MSNCSENKFSLNGTSRNARIPEGLKSGFVQIDERSRKDIYDFINQFGELINFYATDNSIDGNWKDTFAGEVSTDGFTPSQLIIFDAFLEVFYKAIGDLNQFTDKHVEYFYEQVLGFQKKDAQSDKAHVLIELAKHKSTEVLTKGTLFKAGKDDQKNDLFYQLVEDFSFSHATVTSIQSIRRNPIDFGKMHSSPISNSGDGIGGDLINADGSWEAFGTEDRLIRQSGFAISSPLLSLAEGTRNIILTCTFADNELDPIDLDISNFSFDITTEKGWSTFSNTFVGSTENQLVFALTLNPTDPAAVNFNLETHEGLAYVSENPVLRIECKDAYSKIRYSKIKNIEIYVNVSEVKDLVVQNHLGKLDPSKPMDLFGSIPKVGATFYVGSNEVFKNKLDTLTLKFDYLNLPNGRLSDYYANYLDSSDKATNSYVAEYYLLNNRVWENKSEELLFTNSTSSTEGNTSSSFIKNLGSTDSYDHLTQIKNKYDLGTERGFLKLRLSEGNFGHEEFPKAFAQKVAEQAGSASEIDPSQLPNTPISPQIENLSISYSATDNIHFATEGLFETQNSFLHHIGPFGTKKVDAKAITPQYLLPEFSCEGELYIGIDNCQIPQNLSLLFQISEGSANPDLETSPVSWHYLLNNEWVAFEKSQILREETNGLLTSGLISLSLPKQINKDNNWIEGNLVWIRASVKESVEAISDIISIDGQAAKVEFYSYTGQDAEGKELTVSPNGTSVEAGTVGKLKKANSAVKGVNQKYASFDGKAAEEGEAYYLRISERLRHKDRAINLWDYERLLLSQFPSVYKTKCINHTYYNGTVATYAGLKPGYTSIIVVPDVSISNAADPLKPKVSKNTLDEIHSYLSLKNSAHVQLNVQNPIYESIKISLNVKLHKGYDAGISMGLLNEALKEILAPWTQVDGTEIQFGGQIEKSTLIHRLEKLDYVDYLTCVVMNLHRPAGLEDISIQDLEVAKTATAASVLTSYPTHTINNIDDILLAKGHDLDCSCTDCDTNIIKDSLVELDNDCGCS